jgi:hypothetical protein
MPVTPRIIQGPRSARDPRVLRRISDAALLAALALVAGGCPRPPVVEEVPVRQAEVASFSEGSEVRALAVIPPYVFSASRQGLDRWELTTGASLQISAEHGLPGDRVEAMAHDPMRHWLWIATNTGITRYDVQSGTFSELPAPPQALELMPLTSVVIEPAGDGGMWLGHPRGLFYASPTGGWNATAIREPITALHRGSDGSLWVGTERGIIEIIPGGESLRFGAEQGCDVARVRFIATAPGSVPLVVGENAEGEQRVVLMFEQRCASYRVAPSMQLLSAAARGNELLVLTPDRVYSLRTAAPAGPRNLSRDGMRLLPVVWNNALAGTKNPFAITAVDEVEVPRGGRILAASADEVYVGTVSLGTMRVAKGVASWLRRSELVADASTLTVACRAASECYLATGNRGWRYDGLGFELIERPAQAVLAFARSPKGEIYSVLRSENERRLFVERLDDEGSWVRVAGAELETPGVRAVVPFARFAPDGLLWLGLQYREDMGALRPHGLAQVDVSRGSVTYHRRERRRRRQRAPLPVPAMVTDLAFLADGEAWLASTEGAVQIRDDEVKVHKETKDGLKTELVRGIAVSRTGGVFVASRAGVGSWDGKAWTYPAMLVDPVNDVAVGRDGRIWMATQHGLAVYDGTDVRNIDIHRGLLENQLDEVMVDHLGRVWVRGSKGVSVVTP